ncbi:MAG: hypothetical protein Q8Q31_04460 [Nanoarchaeota archaeon]|nr:hypothetical protein [Nanoarchaeota archaeon]
MIRNPRIAVESREHYHGQVKGSTNDFHLGHFRVVQYGLPGLPIQVIYEEFYSTGFEEDGMAPVYCRGLNSQEKDVLQARVPQAQLSRVSYSLALAVALELSHSTGVKLEDSVNKRDFSPVSIKELSTTA